MTTHIIQNGVVVNTIVATVAEAQSAFPDAICIAATTGGIGWTWNGTVLVASPLPGPVITVPSEISPRQIRQALTAFGLRSTLEAAVAASDQDTKDWWEFATVFERAHPRVVGMAEALGVTPLRMDDLWALGASLL